MDNLSFRDINLIKSAISSSIEHKKNLASICPGVAESLNKEVTQYERIISILNQVQDKILENRSFCARLYCQL